MPKFIPYQKGKRAPASGAIDFNSSPENKKQPYGNVDKDQKIANAGDVIPLVFCKRVSNIGGTWIQPSLLKAGVRDLNSSQSFAINQGQMIGTPQTHRIYMGLRNLRMLATRSGTTAVTVTANHRFVSAATYASAKNTCPYPDDGASGMIYCGVDNYTFFEPLHKAVVDQRHNDRNILRIGDFYNFKTITRGIGDTNNTVFTARGNDTILFDNETGNDITANFRAFFIGGVITSFDYNSRLNTSAPFNIIGGHPVGTIREGFYAVDNSGNEDRDYLIERTASAQKFFSSGDEGDTLNFSCSAVNSQRNTSEPADESGALLGVQTQMFVSTRRDPSAYPSTDDFSSFADITLLQITSNAFLDFTEGGTLPDDYKQIYVYYEEGVSVTKYSAGLSGGSYTTGSSNQFVDLALHLFSMVKRSSDGIAELAQPVKLSNLQAVGTFCSTYNMFFNGVLDQPYNLIEYITDISPFFLLGFLSNGGRYEFSPLLPVNGSNAIDVTALTPAATFNETDILAGSYTKTYTPAEERRDTIVNVTYRNVSPTAIATPVGVMVRFSATADDAPVVSFDMSEFCTTKSHATRFAKYELARRKHSTHMVTFETALDTNGLKATDIVKIQRTRINSVGDNRTETDHYQITSITHSTDGTTSFEAMHFPLNGSNIATISSEVVSGSFRETAS